MLFGWLSIFIWKRKQNKFPITNNLRMRKRFRIFKAWIARQPIFWNMWRLYFRDCSVIWGIARRTRRKCCWMNCRKNGVRRRWRLRQIIEFLIIIQIQMERIRLIFSQIFFKFSNEVVHPVNWLMKAINDWEVQQLHEGMNDFSVLRDFDFSLVIFSYFSFSHIYYEILHILFEIIRVFQICVLILMCQIRVFVLSYWNRTLEKDQWWHSATKPQNLSIFELA